MYAEKNSDYSMKFIIELFCAFWVKTTLRGNQCLHTILGHLVLLGREKKSNMYYGSLFMSYEVNYEFIKEIPSSASLIAFIVFSDLIGVENSIHWTC